MAKGGDAGPVKARLISEIGDRRRLSPGHIGIMFRFILDGGGS